METSCLLWVSTCSYQFDAVWPTLYDASSWLTIQNNDWVSSEQFNVPRFCSLHLAKHFDDCSDVINILMIAVTYKLYFSLVIDALPFQMTKQKVLIFACCKKNCCRTWYIYMVHAVAFAAIRTTKTREHFSGKFLYNAIASTDNAQQKNCPSSASTIARAETCLGCWRDFSIPLGRQQANTIGLRRRLHPH